MGTRGASIGNGPSASGPLILSQSKADAGWDIRPDRHWDYTEGRQWA